MISFPKNHIYYKMKRITSKKQLFKVKQKQKNVTAKDKTFAFTLFY